jgi:hypothetical protein
VRRVREECEHGAGPVRGSTKPHHRELLLF